MLEQDNFSTCLIDGHFHPLDMPPGAGPSEFGKRQMGVAASASPGQWAALQSWSASSGSPYVLGVHPWNSRELARLPNPREQVTLWLEQLEVYLSSRGSGASVALPVAVGEIGLDRACCSQETWPWQRLLFTEQYRLAQQYKLPCLIHCVKAYGMLLELLPPVYTYSGLVHAFWGSPEIAGQFLKRGFYISLNSKFIEEVRQATCSISAFRPNSTFQLASTADPSVISKLQKLEKLSRVIPLERLILESDAPWGLVSNLILPKHCQFLAPFWQTDPTRFKEACQANLRTLFL